MTWRTRALRFATVGAIGVVVQLTTVALLADRWGVDYRPATVAGVLLAVAHNFAWHRRWTWRDRADARGIVATFAAFAGANGLVSIAGNVLVVQALVSTLHAPLIAANLVAIVACAIANYIVADRAVF